MSGGGLLLCAAVACAILSSTDAGAQTTPLASNAASAPARAASAPTDSSAVELSKALAWPVVVLLVAGAFRRPFSAFLAALGGRVNKLSAFKVEIELASATAPVSTPLLDDIRSGSSAAAVGDSSRQLLAQVQSTMPADFALIALGEGHEWLTSRLYIAAVMMERMRGAKALVFVQSTESVERQFVALISPRTLRWLLAMKYPWFEVALARAEAQLYQHDDPTTIDQSRILTETGAINAGNAQELVSKFLAHIRRQPPGPSPDRGTEKGWVHLPQYTERAEWVTRSLLYSLLPEGAFEAHIKPAPDHSRARKSRALLRCRAPFVALVGEDGRFLRLLNRQFYLEEVAAALGEEPDK